MNESRKADLMLVSATMLAGIGWIFSKQAISEMPPFLFIGSRFALASLILLPFCIRRIKRLPWMDILKASSVGLLQGIALLLWIYSVSISESLGEGAFIVSLSMLFVPLIAWLLFHQRPSSNFAVALPLAILGLYALSSSGHWTLSGSQMFFFLSALTTALQFNLNSRYSRSIPTVALTCLQFFWTGALALIFSAFFEVWPESYQSITWVWFLASVIPATCFRFLLQIRGQKSTSTTNAALIMILEPLWTVLLSVAIYSEVMTFNKVTGCLLILLSLIVYRFLGHVIGMLRRINRKVLNGS